MTRARGRAYQAIADKLEETLGKAKARIVTIHGGAKQELERLKQIMESKVGVVESIIGANFRLPCRFIVAHVRLG